MPHLQVTELVLVRFDIAINDYQDNSGVLYAFVHNISFGQLLDISLNNVIILKSINLEFSYLEVWFSEQNSKPLEIKDKINITLVIT